MKRSLLFIILVTFAIANESLARTIKMCFQIHTIVLDHDENPMENDSSEEIELESKVKKVRIEGHNYICSLFPFEGRVGFTYLEKYSHSNKDIFSPPPEI